MQTDPRRGSLPSSVTSVPARHSYWGQHSLHISFLEATHPREVNSKGSNWTPGHTKLEIQGMKSKGLEESYCPGSRLKITTSYFIYKINCFVCVYMHILCEQGR